MFITIRVALSAIILAMILMLGAAEAISGPEYNALAEAQMAKEMAEKHVSFSNYNRPGFVYYAVDISNATSELRPKISPGTYNSMSYDIPVGPYQVSFQMRTPLNNSFGVGYKIFNVTTDHAAKYEQYVLYFSPSLSQIHIIHYLGPTDIPPEYPGIQTPSSIKRYDMSPPSVIAVDGKTGSYRTASNKKGTYIMYIVQYQLDPATYIEFSSDMNWENDVFLAIETLHITKSA